MRRIFFAAPAWPRVSIVVSSSVAGSVTGRKRQAQNVRGDLLGGFGRVPEFERGIHLGADGIILDQFDQNRRRLFPA